jgi:hypothetical protein
MRSFAKIVHIGAIAAFAVAILAPTTAQAANFTGAWSFHGVLGHRVVETLDGVCALRQDRAAVVGSCKGPFGVAKAEGAVDGIRIILRIHHIATRGGGVTGVAELKGVWDADGIIRGSWVDSPMPGEVGVFTGHRVH